MEDGGDEVAPGGVRGADDGDLRDAGEVGERQLDLSRVDLGAAADDDVIGASDEVEVIVEVDPAHILGAEPAIAGEGAAGGVWVAPVASHDVGREDADAADAVGVGA